MAARHWEPGKLLPDPRESETHETMEGLAWRPPFGHEGDGVASEGAMTTTSKGLEWMTDLADLATGQARPVGVLKGEYEGTGTVVVLVRDMETSQEASMSPLMPSVPLSLLL